MSTISSVYNEQVGLEVYSKTTKSGLKIYVIPVEEIETVTTNIIVGIGGRDKKYVDRISGKVKNIPAGIAHYIEHLMFYEKNNRDVIKILTENLGSYANAFTEIDRTTYTVESPAGEYINPLRKIMKTVFVPYFSKKTLAKEKEIIASEININEKMQSVLGFVEDMNVIGTKECLEQVTAKDLYNIYENYYTPNNMAIIVYGNVKVKDVMKNIKEMLLKMNITNKPKVIKKEITNFNFDTVKVIKSDRKNPSSMQIGLDFSKVLANKDKALYNIVQKIFLEINFTKLSEFVFDLEDENLIESENAIQDSLDTYYYCKKDLMIIAAKTNEHEKLKEKILNQLENSLKKEPNVEDFNIAKRALYARVLSELIENIHKRVEDVFLYDYKIFDDIDLLEKMTFDEYKRALRKIDLKDVKMYLVYSI